MSTKFRSSHLPMKKAVLQDNEKAKKETKKHPVDVVKALTYKPPKTYLDVHYRDAILYALSVGATPENGLQYIFEKHPQFQTLPTYIVRHAAVFPLETTPGVEWNKFKIMHAEQYLEVFKPIPPNCKIRTEWKVSEVIDKLKSAIVVREATMYDDATNEKLSYGIYNIIHIGAGGFDGQKNSIVDVPGVAVPTDQPDHLIEYPTNNITTALYRIAGEDYNEVHIQPGFGKPMGLDVPILHGLGTMGIVARLVIDIYGNKQVSCSKAIKARFTATANVGETLMIKLWKRKQRVHFQVTVKETGRIHVNNAFIDLHELPTVPSKL